MIGPLSKGLVYCCEQNTAKVGRIGVIVKEDTSSVLSKCPILWLGLWVQHYCCLLQGLMQGLLAEGFGACPQVPNNGLQAESVVRVLMDKDGYLLGRHMCLLQPQEEVLDIGCRTEFTRKKTVLRSQLLQTLIVQQHCCENFVEFGCQGIVQGDPLLG